MTLPGALVGSRGRGDGAGEDSVLRWIMSNPRERRIIASLVATGLALLAWSCAGRIGGGHIWTPWGHGNITNAEWGRRTSELAGFPEGGTNAPRSPQKPTNEHPME